MFEKDREAGFSAAGAIRRFLLAAALLVLPAAASVQTTHWYRMGEGDPSAAAGATPAVLRDASGAQDLALSGATAATAVYSSSVAGVSVTGVSSTLSLSLPAGSAAAQGPLLSTDAENFGFEIWVKPLAASLTGTHCIACNGTPGVDGWGLYLVNGKVILRTGTSTSISGPLLGSTLWSNLAIVRSGGVTTLFNRGASYASSADAIPAPTGGFTLGAAPSTSGPTQFFAGFLDEARSFQVTSTFNPSLDFLATAPEMKVTALPGGSLLNGATYSFPATGTGGQRHGAFFIDSSFAPPGFNMVHVSNVTLTGADAGEFKLENFGFFFADVTLNPVTPGEKSATLSIFTDDPDDNPFVIHLTATAFAAPNLSAFAGANADPATSPPIFYTTPQVFASGGEAKVFTLRNGGQADLHFASFSVLGTDAADFTLAAPATGVSVPAGGSTDLTVTFTPTGPGERYAMLVMSSDAVDSSVYRLALTGEAAGPEIQVAGPDGGALHSHAVLAWGQNYFQECEAPAGLGSATALAAGSEFTAALRSDGTVVVWGYGGSGARDIPAGLSGVTALAAGESHVVALRSDGTVVAWGDNSNHQCDIPAGLNGVTAIAASSQYTLALKNDGTVVAWGDPPFTAVPTGLSGVVAISAGDEHALALKSDGTVIDFGVGTEFDADVPAGLNDATAVIADDVFSAAIRADGSLVQWAPDSDDTLPALPALSAPIAFLTANSESYLATGVDGSLAVTAYQNSYGERSIPAGPPRFFITGAVGQEHFAALYDSLVDFGALDPAHTGAAQTFTVSNTGSTALHLAGASLNGPGAGRYVLDATGLPATLAPGASATLTVASSSQTTGPDAATLQILSDSAHVPAFTVRLAGAIPAISPTPYQSWKLAQFGTVAETGDSADDADPNHNGIPNLVEYAIGGDPLAPGAELSLLPQYALDSSSSTYTLTVTHATTAYDVTVAVQASESIDSNGALVWTDLIRSSAGGVFAWATATHPGYGLSEGIGSSLDHVSLAVPLITAPHRLFRLSVTRP